MGRISYTDREVTRLDLSSQEVLFANEEPEDIIGLSLLSRKNPQPGQQVIGVEYFRIRLASNTWRDPIKMTEKVEKAIQDLQIDKHDCEDVISNPDFTRELDILKSAKATGQTPLALRNPGRRRPFEVNKPTLFIYTTNFCAAFAEPFITPMIGLSDELDPNCSKPRTWQNDQVLGWYSSYKDGAAGTHPGLWYYNLHTPIVDPSSYIFSHSFDPGTGNGGGDEFP